MRWTKRRVARLAFLCGAGASVDDIVRDELIAARSARAVRCVASRPGVSLRDADDLLTVRLSHDDRHPCQLGRLRAAHRAARPAP